MFWKYIVQKYKRVKFRCVPRNHRSIMFWKYIVQKYKQVRFPQNHRNVLEITWRQKIKNGSNNQNIMKIQKHFKYTQDQNKTSMSHVHQVGQRKYNQLNCILHRREVYFKFMETNHKNVTNKNSYCRKCCDI